VLSVVKKKTKKGMGVVTHKATMKRLFVYSAVTQFDTTNTSNGTTPFGEAESWVIRTGFLRIRRSPVRLPRCVLIIFRAGRRVLK
jgi:hypothetical protein